jgi:hypothetical protein
VSLETTLARAEVRRQEQQWRLHLHGCSRCCRAVRGRQWPDLCRFGVPIRDARMTAERELKRNRELDKLPSPDQEALF